MRMNVGWMRLGAACLVLGMVWVGCGEDEEYAKPDDLGRERTHGFTLVERGREAYMTYCAGCHGDKGDGNGESARFFSPRPRNLVLGEFKFSSTRSGELPTDEDLRRTIRNGLRGSAMPPFELLPAATIDSLVAYIKSLSPRWSQSQPARPIPFVEDPYFGDADSSRAIARGEMIYHGYATCWTCHPSYVSREKINEYRTAVNMMSFETLRDDLSAAVGKENTQGELIYPPDFHRDFVRSGASLPDLYRSIAAGITGTAMPTWVDSMELPGAGPDDPPLVEPGDLWALAYYVQHLIRERPTKLAEGAFVIRDRKREIFLHGEPPKAPAVETPADKAADEPVDFDF